MAKCWKCAEEIKDEAVACRFCHANQASRNRRAFDRPLRMSNPDRTDGQTVIIQTGPNSFQSCMGCLGLGVLSLLAVGLGASWLDSVSGPPTLAELAAEQAKATPPPPPRASFAPSALAAARAALAAEPQVLDVFGAGSDPVADWTVAVKGDGTPRVGYAQTLCLLLAEHDVVDANTSVRVVDIDHLTASPGDYRGASLGHVHCESGESMGV